MGLFEKAGRGFEQFKQDVTSAAEEDMEFECSSCGERTYTEHDSCPECGADALVPIEPSEDEPDGGDASDDKNASDDKDE